MTEREIGDLACALAMPLWDRGYEVRWRREVKGMTETGYVLFEVRRGDRLYGVGVSEIAMKYAVRHDLLAAHLSRQVRREFARAFAANIEEEARCS